MGLDTTHNCWHGPYSSFMRWRQEIARAVGVPLPLMEGFYPGIHGAIDRWMEFVAPRPGGPICGDPAGPLLHNWIQGVREWLPIRWDSLRPDPLHVLLSHSDCEGEIAVEDCIPLAERLEEIAPLLSGGPPWHRGEGADAKALQFAAGLREAAAAGEPVEFH
jgi:hypothetical protein